MELGIFDSKKGFESSHMNYFQKSKSVLPNDKLISSDRSRMMCSIDSKRIH